MHVPSVYVEKIRYTWFSHVLPDQQLGFQSASQLQMHFDHVKDPLNSKGMIKKHMVIIKFSLWQHVYSYAHIA